MERALGDTPKTCGTHKETHSPCRNPKECSLCKTREDDRSYNPLVVEALGWKTIPQGDQRAHQTPGGAQLARGEPHADHAELVQPLCGRELQQSDKSCLQNWGFIMCKAASNSHQEQAIGFRIRRARGYGPRAEDPPVLHPARPGQQQVRLHGRRHLEHHPLGLHQAESQFHRERHRNAPQSMVPGPGVPRLDRAAGDGTDQEPHEGLDGGPHRHQAEPTAQGQDLDQTGGAGTCRARAALLRRGRVPRPAGGTDTGGPQEAGGRRTWAKNPRNTRGWTLRARRRTQVIDTVETAPALVGALMGFATSLKETADEDPRAWPASTPRARTRRWTTRISPRWKMVSENLLEDRPPAKEDRRHLRPQVVPGHHRTRRGRLPPTLGEEVLRDPEEFRQWAMEQDAASSTRGRTSCRPTSGPPSSPT